MNKKHRIAANHVKEKDVNLFCRGRIEYTQQYSNMILFLILWWHFVDIIIIIIIQARLMFTIHVFASPNVVPLGTLLNRRGRPKKNEKRKITIVTVAFVQVSQHTVYCQLFIKYKNQFLYFLFHSISSDQKHSNTVNGLELK